MHIHTMDGVGRLGFDGPEPAQNPQTSTPLNQDLFNPGTGQHRPFSAKPGK